MSNTVSAPRAVIATSFVSLIGTWLTTLALSLSVLRDSGAGAVAFLVAVQATPPLLIARGVLPRFERLPARGLLISTNVGLAGLTLGLAVVGVASLPIIFGYVFVTSLAKSIAEPVFTTAIGSWCRDEERVVLFTRIATVSAATAALAPFAGGVLSETLGLRFVLVVDAATYVIAALIMQRLPRVAPIGDSAAPKPRGLDTFRFPALGPQVRAVTVYSISLLSFGALVNSFEYIVFEDLELSDSEIGLQIALWGAGAVVAGLATLSKRALGLVEMHQASIVGVLAIMLASYGRVGVVVSYAQFFLAGTCMTLLLGAARAVLQNELRASRTSNEADVWAFLGQMGASLSVGSAVLVVVALAAFSSDWVLAGCSALSLVLGLVAVRSVTRYAHTELDAGPAEEVERIEPAVEGEHDE